MGKKIILCLLMIMACGVFAMRADDVSTQKIIAQADSAYLSKDYAKAIDLYNNIRQEEGSNSALLYNLGNAYYQEGDYGNAMACYLRAKRLDPRNGEINANLTYLKSKVDDANKAEQKGKRLSISPDEEGFFQSVRRAVAVNVSSDLWAILAAACFVIFVGGVALYIFSRNVAARKIGFFGSMVLLGATVVFLCFAFMGANTFSSREEGVISAFKTTLQTEPGNENISEKGNVLTKGSVVRIISEETDAEGNVTWYKVRLNSDYIGWTAAENVIVI